TFKERGDHPCQMPEALLERIIRVSSNPEDLVLDPFAGSGTTLAVAKKLGRKWLGGEVSEAYAAKGRARLGEDSGPGGPAGTGGRSGGERGPRGGRGRREPSPPRGAPARGEPGCFTSSPSRRPAARSPARR